MRCQLLLPLLLIALQPQTDALPVKRGAAALLAANGLYFANPEGESCNDLTVVHLSKPGTEVHRGVHVSDLDPDSVQYLDSVDRLCHVVPVDTDLSDLDDVELSQLSMILDDADESEASHVLARRQSSHSLQKRYNSIKSISYTNCDGTPTAENGNNIIPPGLGNRLRSAGFDIFQMGGTRGQRGSFVGFSEQENPDSVCTFTIFNANAVNNVQYEFDGNSDKCANLLAGSGCLSSASTSSSTTSSSTSTTSSSTSTSSTSSTSDAPTTSSTSTTSSDSSTSSPSTSSSSTTPVTTPNTSTLTSTTSTTPSSSSTTSRTSTTSSKKPSPTPIKLPSASEVQQYLRRFGFNVQLSVIEKVLKAVGKAFKTRDEFYFSCFREYVNNRRKYDTPKRLGRRETLEELD